MAVALGYFMINERELWPHLSQLANIRPSDLGMLHMGKIEPG